MFFKKKSKVIPEQADNIQSQIKGEPQKYSSEKYGISFTVPAGIHLYTVENSGPLKNRLSAETPFILVNPGFKDENINIKVSEGVAESDLYKFKNMLDNDPNMPLPKYKRVSVGLCRVGRQGEKPGVEHVFYQKGNIYGKMRQITFQNSGWGFTCTCGTAEERYDTANQQFFEPFFKNLEFVKGVGNAILRWVPFAEWKMIPKQEAEDRFIQKMQSAGKKFLIGENVDPNNKNGLIFISDEFVESADFLPEGLLKLSEYTKNKNVIMKEIYKHVTNDSKTMNVVCVGEIEGDADRLALKTDSDIVVIVDKISFDYNLTRHEGGKILLLIPQRVVMFTKGDGRDGLLEPVKK